MNEYSFSLFTGEPGSGEIVPGMGRATILHPGSGYAVDRAPIITPGGTGSYLLVEPGLLLPPSVLRPTRWNSMRMLGAAILGALAEEKPTPPEPEVDTTRTEPFVAWKQLWVVKRPEGWRVQGYQDFYLPDATAHCKNGFDHEVPDWNCTCGFYALKERPEEAPDDSWWAQVELFGRVIEAENGWRASRQRVLCFEVPRVCDICAAPAKGVGFAGASMVLGTVCENCAPFGMGTLAQISEYIGTEVRWVPKLEATDEH